MDGVSLGDGFWVPSSVTRHPKPQTSQEDSQHGLADAGTDGGRSAVLLPGPDPGPNLSLTWTSPGDAKGRWTQPPRPQGAVLTHKPRSICSPEAGEGPARRETRGAGVGRDIPEQALETAAAETLRASGGASAEWGPPPGTSELGREADGGAPAGGDPRTVGPGQAAEAPAGPAGEAGERGASLRPASC